MLGDKIKQARTTSHITQRELARVVGVSDKSISAYESGRINPPLDVLTKIAEETSTPLPSFFDQSKESTIIAKLTEIARLFEEVKTLLKQ